MTRLALALALGLPKYPGAGRLDFSLDLPQQHRLRPGSAQSPSRRMKA